MLATASHSFNFFLGADNLLQKGSNYENYASEYLSCSESGSCVGD